MIEIKSVGFFRELRHGDENGPSLEAAVNQGNYGDDKAKLLTYLKAGLVFVASPRVGRDALSPSDFSGPYHVMTDGRWAWPADLAFYVDRYNVGLPPAFLADLRARHWRSPAGGEVDLANLEMEKS